MSPEQSPHAGVIHDIGYRHYDGPRLGRASIRRSLFVESLRGAYGLGRSARSKVMPMLLLAAMCLPAVVLSAVAAITQADELPADYASYVLNLQIVIAVFVAAQAPVSVSRDLRFQVMSLYFSRPMQRIDYVVARYAALATAVFLLIALPLTILLAGALLAELPLSENLPDYLRALAAGVLYALVLSGIGLVIAAITPRRGLGIAAIIAVLVVLIGVQALTQEIAIEEGADTAAGYFGLLSPFSLVDGVSRELLGTESALAAGPPGTTGAVVFATVVVLEIAVAFALLMLRYRKVSVA